MRKRRLLAVLCAGLFAGSVALVQPVPAGAQGYGEGPGASGTGGARIGPGYSQPSDGVARDEVTVARALPNTGGAIGGPEVIAVIALTGAGLALGTRAVRRRRSGAS